MNDPEPHAAADARSNLSEIRWQVDNSYALIRSIIRWSAESATTVDSYVWHLEGRMDVIGRIILAVMRNPAASFDLAHLVEDELNNQHASDGRNAWSLNGPLVRLNTPAAQVMGLLFHELVTNSIEHGALGLDEGGELRVSWRVEPESEGREAMLHLDWIERGVPASLSREGFGSMVLKEMFRYQLDGSAKRELDRQGVRISLTVPMHNLARDHEPPVRN